MSIKKPKENLEKSFEQLESITRELQGDLDLEQSLKKFEQGLVIAEQLKKRLSEIENKIEKIKINFSKTNQKE